MKHQCVKLDDSLLIKMVNYPGVEMLIYLMKHCVDARLLAWLHIDWLVVLCQFNITWLFDKSVKFVMNLQGKCIATSFFPIIACCSVEYALHVYCIA